MIAAAQSVGTPCVLDVPVQRFEHYTSAARAITEYEATLRRNASHRRASGMTVTDQGHPEEMFCLFPPLANQPPLTIIGGMGPLAGALAFSQACARFQESRAIILYQACSVPDRSTVILSEGRLDSPACHEVALRLADAVRLAVDLVTVGEERVSCIIACNSAHYFWPLIIDGLREFASRPSPVKMISLVESSLERLRFQRCKKTLLLTTEGAQTGQVFSAPYRDAAIAFDEPSPEASHLLMRAIFEGIKSLDEGRAVELGNEFFELILQSGREYDCIVAGCTELPFTIDLLRRHGSPDVAAFLSRVTIIDPLEEAFGHV